RAGPHLLKASGEGRPACEPSPPITRGGLGSLCSVAVKPATGPAAACVHGDEDPVPNGEKQRDNADDDSSERQTSAALTGFGDPAPGGGSEPDPGDRSQPAEREN